MRDQRDPQVGDVWRHDGDGDYRYQVIAIHDERWVGFQSVASRAMTPKWLWDTHFQDNYTYVPPEPPGPPDTIYVWHYENGQMMNDLQAEPPNRLGGWEYQRVRYIPPEGQ